MLKIIIRGKYDKKIEDIFKRMEINSKTNLLLLAKETVNTMKQEIVNAKTRPSGEGKLEKSIEHGMLETIGNMVSIGVGLIAKLPVYWRAINYGSGHLVGKVVPGHFEGDRPRAGGKDQKFTYQKNTFLMKVMKPIKGINFIERTVAKMRVLLPTIFRR